MTRTLFTAAAAVLAFATPALAAEEHSFTHEGVTYQYSVTPTESARILEGKASTGGTFRLVVKNGWVSGRVDGARVSFRAPKKAQGLSVAQR